jgi:hypothetical protein
MCRLSCNSSRGDGIRIPRRTVYSHHTSNCRWREALTLRKCVLSLISAACEWRWRRTTLQKGLCNANAASDLGTRNVNVATHLGVWLAEMRNHLGRVSLKNKCWSCGGNHIADYHGYSKWKEAKAAAAKRAQGERGRKDGVSTLLPASKSAPTNLSSEQEKRAPRWNHVRAWRWHLPPERQATWFGSGPQVHKYVCSRTDRPIWGGGTAILVRRGIHH